jgi:hypothetical protein
VRLGLPNGLFPSGFATKILYAFVIPPMLLILLHIIILTICGEVYKLRSSSLCSLLQPPATSSLLRPNILLSTLFPDTLNLCYFLGVRDQVPHPYKTTSKIILLHILIFKIFKNETGRQKTLN